MAVTAWKYPTLILQDTGSPFWDDVTKMYSDNGVYATSTNAKVTGYINVFFEFTASQVPSGATINGLEIAYKRYSSVASLEIETWFDFSLPSSQSWVQKANAVGSNYASAVTWSTSPEEVIRGGASDLWGWTPTQSDIVNPNLNLCFRSASSSNTVNYIDYFKMRVYYTEGGGATGQPTSKRFGGVPFATLRNGIWCL